MRQAHARSGRLRENVEDIVSANSDIGSTRVELPMDGMLMVLDKRKMDEAIFAQPP